ncbi:putative interleukin-17 receptor E-like [Puntigrus tetrazona]|uniref:putative interleukin-17 receptor E-like n=1 Tax=Puntigrus tetrazona TaxID=1606681 RepID=UPI001C88FFB9|nr:putative interleukin-17 receptor E-like [Puntigrus tetrazona]XP_043083269.1 putative interleukin-17 receptor E-like [Puntigrus tetrazona]
MKHLLLLLLILQNHKIHMDGIERSQDCGWSCSEGLQCKPRVYSPLSAFHCRNQPVSSAVFSDVMLSSVLACEEKKCSLQLKIATSVNATGNIRGVSVCADFAGMMGHCQVYTFGHVGKGKATGKLVDVRFKCVPVRPGQLVFVTLKTIPNYCTAMWTQRHLVPDCSHEGIRDEIAECITGKLAYTVDKDRNTLTVKVNDAPEDTDYNLRLCHKRNIICAGEGAHRKIKPQQLQSSIMLHYSKPLPCLCIEGWPARVDARRVQACPFKNNLEELWSGITYDVNEEELIWEPQCPVRVSVSLCHADGQNSCLDIGKVFHSDGQKVIFSSVDPHPTLCTKFTTEVGTWIKCPFTKGNFSVWTAKVTVKDGQQWAEISTWVKASFSISVCEMKPSSQCERIEGNKLQNHSLDKMKRAVFNLSKRACEVCICIQVQRVDVHFSVPVLQCNLQCSNWCRDPERSQDIEKILLPAVIFLMLIMAAVLFGRIKIKDGDEKRTAWTKLTCLRMNQ